MRSMIVVALALVAVAVAVPVVEEPPKTIQESFDQQPDGSYDSKFETENGIKRAESGKLKEVLDEENKTVQVLVVRGEYSYIDSEGKPETISYIADETGYHAEGDSIPKPARR